MEDQMREAHLPIVSVFAPLALTGLCVAQPCQPHWEALGSGVSSVVRKFYPYDIDGDGPIPLSMYVGGNFQTAGGIPAARIARWDGLTWSALGAGLNSESRAIVAFDEDASGPAAPVLMVGGFFTTAGGLPASRIARWNGTAWSAVGGGMGTGTSLSVEELVVFDEDGAGPNPPALFAAGVFDTAGGVPANNVARWNGQAWSAVGGGFTDTAVALHVHDE